jgi:hypothetical protein
MRRFLLLLAPLAASGLASQALPACAGDSAGCNQTSLANSPAFLLPFEGEVDEDGCTIAGFAVDEAGAQTPMECVEYGEDCLCLGGALPGVYEVAIVDVESGDEIDDMEVTVHAAPPPDCRAPEVTRPFDAAFAHTFFGVGGHGGVGGAEP